MCDVCGKTKFELVREELEKITVKPTISLNEFVEIMFGLSCFFNCINELNKKMQEVHKIRLYRGCDNICVKDLDGEYLFTASRFQDDLLLFSGNKEKYKETRDDILELSIRESLYFKFVRVLQTRIQISTGTQIVISMKPCDYFCSAINVEICGKKTGYFVYLDNNNITELKYVPIAGDAKLKKYLEDNKERFVKGIQIPKEKIIGMLDIYEEVIEYSKKQGK